MTRKAALRSLPVHTHLSVRGNFAAARSLCLHTGPNVVAWLLAKRLVLADTTLFADMKEPKDKIAAGEVTKVLRMIYLMRLRRTPHFQGIRIILAFLALPCKWHEEQCTVAEFTAYWSRDVLAHIDLAAEARVKKPSKTLQPDETDSDIEDDLSATKPRELEFVDLGGGDNIAANIADEEVPLGEVSSFPLTDPMTTLSLCSQEAELVALDTKKRKRQPDLGLRVLRDTYAPLLQQDFSLDSQAHKLPHGFGKHASHMVALQRSTMELLKRQAVSQTTQRKVMTPMISTCQAALLSLFSRNWYL